MIQLDPFLTAHSIETLRAKTKSMQSELDAFIESSNLRAEDAENKIRDLMDGDTALGNSIQHLSGLVINMSARIDELNEEIVQSKLTNIKQEMMTRTMFNLQHYKAHDMFVDTFVTAENIDFDQSIRAEWFEDYKAIGRTTASTVYVDQPSHKTYILVTGNASDDNGLSQSFILDKTQMIDKVSLYIQKHSEETWRPMLVRISTDVAGQNLLSTGVIEATSITEAGFYTIPVSNTLLEKHTDYYISVSTVDTYGYRIGVDTTGDKYFAGTSYIKYNNVWTDNNFDIAFKVWCFAAVDEDNATLITKEVTLTEPMKSIVFDVEAVTFSGSVNYYVTIDNGTNWKILQPGVETLLDDLEGGDKLRIRAYIDGNARIDAWGYVLRRGEAE